MGISDQRYAYRPNPQVSAAQIASYLVATPTGRKRIVCSARFPKRSVVAQYGKAREGLVNFLGDGTRSLHHLADATDYLTKRANKTGVTEWLQRDSWQSIGAIEAFQRSYNKLGLRPRDCRQVVGRLPPINDWATKVSVDLDFTIHVPADECDHIGAAILLFSRGEASDAKRIEQSKTIASLIFYFCNQFMMSQGNPDKKLCMAVDVFAGKSHGPQGTRKIDHVRDACDEIAARWPSVSPPDDYDGPDPT